MSDSIKVALKVDESRNSSNPIGQNFVVMSVVGWLFVSQLILQSAGKQRRTCSIEVVSESAIIGKDSQLLSYACPQVQHSLACFGLFEYQIVVLCSAKVSGEVGPVAYTGVGRRLPQFVSLNSTIGKNPHIITL